MREIKFDFRIVFYLIEEATRLNYPVRYWWLSQAMDNQNSPDRLIMSVHHPSRDENTGMDLYDALQARQVPMMKWMLLWWKD